MAFIASSSESNTLAGPLWTNISSATAERLTTAPSLAILPRSTAIPPVGLYGSSMLLITVRSVASASLIFSHTVFPVTVMRSRCSRPFFDSSFMTACTPPAIQRSCTWWGPAGASLQRLGTLALISLIMSRLIFMPASLAIAGRCRTELVEHPSAISTASAFSNAFSVNMSEGFIPFSTSSITFMPACFASLILSAYTAGIVPLPGNPMPSTSVRQFMEFAVNIPEHDPQPGHA